MRFLLRFGALILGAVAVAGSGAGCIDPVDVSACDDYDQHDGRLTFPLGCTASGMVIEKVATACTPRDGVTYVMDQRSCTQGEVCVGAGYCSPPMNSDAGVTNDAGDDAGDATNDAVPD